MENDQLDDTIIPDPEDPGEEFTLPELVAFADEPEDPEADQSPEEPEGAEADDE